MGEPTYQLAQLLSLPESPELLKMKMADFNVNFLEITTGPCRQMTEINGMASGKRQGKRTPTLSKS